MDDDDACIFTTFNDVEDMQLGLCHYYSIMMCVVNSRNCKGNLLQLAFNTTQHHRVLPHGLGRDVDQSGHNITLTLGMISGNIPPSQY